jgi:hypothetical protein
MKFICPNCGKEAEKPSRMFWSDGSVSMVTGEGLFPRKYVAHCHCWKCGGRLGMAFDVELTKEQARQLNDEANTKSIVPKGRVIE